MKIYSDDSEVPYKTTKINAQRTRADIDGILAKWGIKKVAWNLDPNNNVVELQFQISELIDDRTVEPVVKVEPPRIWQKATRNRKGQVNWDVSMRVMFWFIKTHLEMAYLMQSDKTTQFLPYIQVSETKLVKDVLVPRISFVKDLQALEDKIIRVPHLKQNEK